MPRHRFVVSSNPPGGQQTLFLDDDPRRHAAFIALSARRRQSAATVHVTSAAGAVAALDTVARPFTEVFLDHDLCAADILSAPGEPTVKPTGLVVARHLCMLSRARRPARVIVHSCNTLGAQAMVELLTAAAASDGWPLSCVHVPFPYLGSYFATEEGMAPEACQMLGRLASS